MDLSSPSMNVGFPPVTRAKIEEIVPLCVCVNVARSERNVPFSLLPLLSSRKVSKL